MSYTMEDFKHDYVTKHFAELTLEEQRRAIERMVAERRQEVLALLLRDRLAGLSPKRARQYLDELAGGQPAKPRKPRRKK